MTSFIRVLALSVLMLSIPALGQDVDAPAAPADTVEAPMADAGPVPEVEAPVKKHAKKKNKNKAKKKKKMAKKKANKKKGKKKRAA